MINNIDSILNKVQTNKRLAKYLIGKGFPILGLKGKWTYFANTYELQRVLTNLPLWLKVAKYL